MDDSKFSYNTKMEKRRRREREREKYWDRPKFNFIRK